MTLDDYDDEDYVFDTFFQAFVGEQDEAVPHFSFLDDDTE